jgi:uncharacterized FlaG/YvyC family protein
MTINEVLALQTVEAASPQEGPSGSAREQAARNREIVKAIKTINESGGIGASSELRFAIDRDTRQALIRIVDRVTNEVIGQVPPEALLRAAEVLRELREVGEREEGG